MRPSTLEFLIVTLLALMTMSPFTSFASITVPFVLTVRPFIGVSATPAVTPVVAAVGQLPVGAGTGAGAGAGAGDGFVGTDPGGFPGVGVVGGVVASGFAGGVGLVVGFVVGSAGVGLPLPLAPEPGFWEPWFEP